MICCPDSPCFRHIGIAPLPPNATTRLKHVSVSPLFLRQIQLDEQAKFLDNELANNKEVDARIAMFDREVGKLRIVYGREKEQVDSFVQELEILKTTLSKVQLGNPRGTALRGREEGRGVKGGDGDETGQGDRERETMRRQMAEWGV